MIQKTQAFKSSDGEIHASIGEAQFAELTNLLEPSIASAVNEQNGRYVINAILENALKIIDILTTTPNSLPAARAVNGNKRPRKKKEDTSTTSGISIDTPKISS